MKRLSVAVVALLVGVGMLGAQDAAGPSRPGDGQTAPPASNAIVARLSLMKGTVSTQRGDTGQWVAGALNTPLVSGDKVAAGADARAEVQLDYADVLRLGDNSQANLVTLNQNQIQIQLGSGLADYAVLHDPKATSEIDTPNVAIHPRGQGVLRIMVPNDGETKVIVRQGEADITTPQGSTTLHDGQQIDVQGTDNPEYQITDAPAKDGWDQWNQSRDTSMREAKSLEYTNPYYTGIGDLDSYGYWTTVPGYGEVWVPDNEGPNWSPYSDGTWEWEPNWGWTWVDYSPWGWAPYHYGRWFVYGPRWVWWPGPVTPFYRPIWAPAYVSFFGWGGGWGFGVGIGSVGWLPIGPCDPFYPWWGGAAFMRFGFGGGWGWGHGYGHYWPALAVGGRGRIAYSNMRGLDSNPRIRAGLVRMPGNEFGHAGFHAYGHVSASEIRSGALMGGRLPATPTRASLSTTRTVGAPVHGAATHFFGSTHAATAPRSFAEERSSTGTRAGTSERTFARANSAPRAEATAPRAGWQRFSAAGGARAEGGARFESGSRPVPAEHYSAPGGRAPESSARPGWQRFQPSGEAPYRANPAARGGDERPALNMGHPIVDSPRYSAPREAAPRYEAPRSNGGGGYRPSAPERSGGGGGGFRPSGGGHPSGGGSHGGGGGGHRH